MLDNNAKAGYNSVQYQVNVRTDMSGTGQVLGATTSSAVTTAVVLPNTGGNVFVTLAVAIAAGLLVWGGLYAYVNR